MDNVTHSLIGITLGRTLRSKSPARSRAAIWTAVIGNNFPDFDFIMNLGAKLTSNESKLSYLLNHRGHSHTFLFTLLAAPLVAWISAKLARNSAEWKRMIPLALLSMGLHIGADYLNNYGIHPFFPSNLNWYYGDTLFIIEPILWLTMIPLALFQLKNWIGRFIFLAAYLFMMGLIWFGPFFELRFQLGLTSISIVWMLFQIKVKNPAPAWIGLVATVLAFSLIQRKTKLLLTEVFHQQIKEHPSEVLEDLILTAAPSNPWCWNVWWVSQNQNQDFIARIGNWSWNPKFQNPENCHPQVPENFSAPIQRPALELNPQPGHNPLHLIGKFQAPISEAKKLANESCAFRQLLRFSRVPFWNLAIQPALAGDLRYDHGPAMNWAKITLNDPTECSAFEPGWIPPRKAFR